MRRSGEQLLGGCRLARSGWAAALLWFAATLLPAQELSPRFYWPTPQGTKLAIFGFAYATGDVLMDPSLPVAGVDSRVNTAYLGYLQTFSLWGRTTNVVFEVPYAWGTTEGLLFGLPARRDFSGVGDAAVTFAINLYGAPAMTLEEFRQLDRFPPKILGASLKLVTPTGRYDRHRLINVGLHRWAAKLELGSALPLRHGLILEVELGGWYFGDDDEFVAGKREQSPLFAAEVHLVRRFRSGIWASVEANFFTGGRSTIAGTLRADLQRNSKVGGTLLFPFRRRHSIKVGYNRGVITAIGGEFDQFTTSYQVLFR